MTTPTNDPTTELAERVALQTHGKSRAVWVNRSELTETIAAELRPLVEACQEADRIADMARSELSPAVLAYWLHHLGDIARTALDAARSGKEGGCDER